MKCTIIGSSCAGMGSLKMTQTNCPGMRRRPEPVSRAVLGLLAALVVVVGATAVAAMLPATAMADENTVARVGQPAPDSSLTDTDGHTHQLSDYLEQGKTVVLEWFNPDCPFVKRHHEGENTMKQLHAKYRQQDVVWLAVNSGAPGKQGHGKQRNAEARKQYGIGYPVLLDDSGRVGRLYDAKTTPHMFIIKSDGTLVYAGGIDDDPRGSKAQRAEHLANALATHLEGGEISPAQTQPYGCSVKYGAAVSKTSSKVSM